MTAFENESMVPVSVILPSDDMRLLGEFAVLDDTNVADQIRAAVDEYTIERKADPELPQRIEAAKNRPKSIIQLMRDAGLM